MPKRSRRTQSPTLIDLAAAAEVSVKTASPLKPGGVSTIIVDKASFKLTAKADRAYVLDATEELKLLEAMKKGSSVIVVAQTEQGVVAKDTYSLAGHPGPAGDYGSV